MPYSLSPSKLSVLKECPRCFWLAVKKGIKRPGGIFPSLPSGMDRIIKMHFDRFIGKGLPPEIAELRGYSLFDDIGKKRVWRTNFSGIQWKDDDGNLFRGAVDEILVRDGKLVVFDYKTRGYPVKEDTASYYQDQLDIYTLLLQKNGYETEDHAFLLFYYPEEFAEDGDVEFNTELVRMDVSVENAERIFAEALEVLDGDCPPGGKCEYCEWMKESEAACQE